MARDTEKIIVQVVVKGQEQLKNLDKQTQNATKSAGSLVKRLGRMAAGVTAAVVAFRKLSAVISAGVKTFKEFEFEMAKVRAITGASEKDFRKLEATALQLGRTTFFTAQQVAQLQVNFGKLGFSTQEILDAQEATLLLATATQSDLGRAAIVAGATVRGFGLDASETARVVDVMAEAFTSSALDIEKFQTSMTKVSPIAAAANITLESTTAVMGTLTDAGIEASIAGTSLRNIFLKMADPASDLSKHLGFTVNSSEDLEKALLKLNGESLSNAEMMELVDLRQVAAFATMVNGTDNILDMTDAFEQANGAAKEMADIMADTLQGDILQAKSAWEGFTQALIEGRIGRTLRAFTQGFTFTINKFTDNMKDAESLAVDVFQEQLNIAKTQQKELAEIGEETTMVEQIQFRINELEREQEVRSQRVGLTERDEKKRQKVFQATELAIKDLREEVERLTKAEEAKRKKDKLDADIEAEKARRAKEKQKELDRKQREKEIDKLERKRQEALKKEITDEKNKFTSLLNMEKEALRFGIITQEEFDDIAFKLEQGHLGELALIYESYGVSIVDIQNKILDNQLANNKKENEDNAKLNQDKLDRQKELKDFSLQTAGSLSDMLFQIEEQNSQRRLDKEIKSLDAKLEAGIVSQETYDKKLDNINRRAFKRDKRKNLAQAGMEMALSIIEASPDVLKMALATTVGLSGIGIIASQQYARGGMVHGKSHANGGEKFAVGGRVVELEGGEAVINKRSTSMFRSQLSAMNAAGGGVKFADGGLLNMPSFATNQFNAVGMNGLAGAMSQGGRVYVLESDITNTQNNVSLIQSQAGF